MTNPLLPLACFTLVLAALFCVAGLFLDGQRAMSAGLTSLAFCAVTVALACIEIIAA